MLWCYPLTFGWAGVSLFFVISGFCIHYSFLRSGRFDAGQFFWRRLWRIYPAYLVALLALAIAAPLDMRSRDGAFQMASHGLLVHNVSYDTFFGINGSFWSIAVEIQLYLLFPLLLFFREKMGLVRSMSVLFAVGCVWRLGVLWLWPMPEHLITPAWTCPLVTWFDWSLGAFVAERFASGRRAFGRQGVWLAALVPLLVVSTLIKPLTIFSFMLASAASAVLLDVALSASWRRGWTVRSLTFVGGISYSVYLWHQPLLAPLLSIVTRLTGSPAAAWLTLPPLILAVAWLSFHLLERPGIDAGRAIASAWARRAPQSPAVHSAVAAHDLAEPATVQLRIARPAEFGDAEKAAA